MRNAWPELVKLHRTQYGLTQVQLAALLGVSQRTVSRWERCEDRPSFAMQRKLRDLRYRTSPSLAHSLWFAVAHCPAPRALSSMPGLHLRAVSPPAIAKRPSIVDRLGSDLTSIASGVLRDMLDDHALQRGIASREIASVVAITRSVLSTPEAPAIGIFLTTISYLEVEGVLLSDAISVPATPTEALGYRAIAFDDLRSE